MTMPARSGQATYCTGSGDNMPDDNTISVDTTMKKLK
ncbi:hypothetical protein LCGC14_2100940, partial [marine sediment metagenome]